VARVWDGPVPAGETRITWDGTSAKGTPLSSGVYFLRVTVEGDVRTVKLTLLK
jgi:hypothetical protein